MAHPQTLKKELRQLYCFEKHSLETCAEKLGVSYSTARNWKRSAGNSGDDWDVVRTAHTLAGNSVEDFARQVLTDIMIEFQSTMKVLRKETSISAVERSEAMVKLSDSFIKAVAANTKLLPQESKLAVAMEVLNLFADFIKTNKPELLHAFLDVLEPFGEKLEKELK